MTSHHIATDGRVKLETAAIGVILATWVVIGGGLIAIESADLFGALSWSGVTAAVMAGELLYLRWLLGPTFNAGELDPDGGYSLGIANGLSLLRGGLYAVVAGFVVVSPTALPWAPAICYGLGVGMDWLDGLIARTLGRPTRLGEQLDLAFDTLGFVIAPVVAVVWEQLPVWYLALSAARYVFKGGVVLRRRRGRPVYDLPPSRLRRPLAALQMCFLTVALSPIVSLSTIRLPAAVLLSASLLLFGRDYLAVSGVLRPSASRTD